MFLQDWLTWKIVELKWVSIDEKEVKVWDKIVYTKEWKKYIWINIWHACETDIDGEFLYKLKYGQVEKFKENNKKALEIFEDWKIEAKALFPGMFPITWRMDITGRQVYLYFFSTERYDFRPHLNKLREIIGMNFFLFQSGARDRIRMNPISYECVGPCGLELCCIKNKCRIETVETEIIWLQNLEAQGLERNKGICGKLKCCLTYEKDVYKSELKSYPNKWDIIKIEDDKFRVIWYNIISRTVFLRNKEGFMRTENLDDLDFKK